MKKSKKTKRDKTTVVTDEEAKTTSAVLTREGKTRYWVWNRVLTGEEIEKLYKTGPPLTYKF